MEYVDTEEIVRFHYVTGFVTKSCHNLLGYVDYVKRNQIDGRNVTVRKCNRAR